MRLRDLKDLYLLTTEWHSLSPSSKRIYEQGMCYIEELMDKDADKINRAVVLDFRDRNYDTRAKCR